jgi:hypothetical protein
MLIAAVTSLWLAALPPLSCGGPYVPPTDFDDRGNPLQMEYAVAQQSAGSGLDALGEKAKHLLVTRLCSYADRSTCAPLAAATKLWSTGKTNGVECAMAVLPSRAVEQWRNQLAPDIEADIRAAVVRLIPPTGAKEFGKKKAVIVLGNVVDMGAPGGVRADWLLNRVRATLTDIGIDVREAPSPWNGQRPPPGIQYVLVGTLTERVDAKRQLPVIEVTFAVIDAGNNRKTAPGFTIPAALAPMPPKAVPPPPPPQIGLQLHVETRAGGSLCPGDYTQLHIANETADPMFVRVFNIDDNGEVLVLFPNEGRADDVVPGGKSVTLSADGFTIDGAAHGRERYIAIGAKSPEELGRFQKTIGTCRYAAAEAAKLRDGSALQAPYKTATGFSVLDDVRCKKPIALPDRALVQASLAQVPLCK